MNKPNVIHPTLTLACGALLSASLVPVASAEIMPEQRNQTTIEDRALQGFRGAVQLNMAAGDGNLQSNSAAIASGSDATADAQVSQQVEITSNMNSGSVPGENRVQIQQQAVNDARGWISINQAAGPANVQSNSMGVALGIEGSALSRKGLDQVLSGNQAPGLNPDGLAEADNRLDIDSSAFDGSRGVIQVNQSAGKGNATHNRVGMRMSHGDGS